MKLSNCQFTKERRGLCSVVLFLVLAMSIMSWTPVSAAATITEVSSIEHDSFKSLDNSFVQVDADTFALAYAGIDDDGFISTFDISADGTTITEVTNIEHDTIRGNYNSFVQVDANTFALAYSGNGDDGFIATFDISADGTTITEVSSIEHDGLGGKHNSFVQVDADTFALAYAGFGDDGFIKTFDISADGTTITEVSSIEHDTKEGTYNSFVQVDADTFALAYTGQANHGYIATFDISADGTTITEVSSVEHDTIRGTDNSFVQVDADTFALAYAGFDNDGYIATFDISADGTTITEVSSLEHDTLDGTDNFFLQVDANTFLLAYAGGDNNGYITTFNISADGITITELDSIEHDTSRGTDNFFLQVDADTFALAYAGNNNDGWIATFDINVTNAPVVTITAPADGSSFGIGDSILFTGTAIDTEDGDISASLSWSSDIDGVIGSGASFSISTLSEGTHTITVSVTDSDGNSASASISISTPTQNDNDGGMNSWDTRPTFGVSHETREDVVVDYGFRFNGESFAVIDNHHTPFDEQIIEIGAFNSFAATVYADKGLKVQEFLFGVPGIGMGHLAEMRVEVWFDYAGEIQDYKVYQDSEIIDRASLLVTHQKSKCQATDIEENCDTTFMYAVFLEPLKDKTMAIKAIDFKRRDQTTYLNDGFDVSGTSLNPMNTMMIPSTVKYEGLIKVTQNEKYSKYWTTDDGRIFEMNSFGSFKQINQEFKRFQDTGKPDNRLHSGFARIIEFEAERALKVFDASELSGDYFR